MHACARLLPLHAAGATIFRLAAPAAAGSEAGVLKKLSLAGLGKLIRLSYS